ncbi:helix-turn-helix domain-containing protein [Rhizobium sp. ICMP 5592]
MELLIPRPLVSSMIVRESQVSHRAALNLTHC